MKKFKAKRLSVSGNDNFQLSRTGSNYWYLFGNGTVTFGYSMSGNNYSIMSRSGLFNDNKPSYVRSNSGKLII